MKQKLGCLGKGHWPNHYYAKEAILTHLEDLEDAYMAEAAYLRFKASGEKAIPLEDVWRLEKYTSPLLPLARQGPMGKIT